MPLQVGVPYSATPQQLGQLAGYILPGQQGGYSPVASDTSSHSGGGSGYSSGGGTASAPSIDNAAIAQYDQGIGNVNAGINRLGDQLNSGYSEIDSSYQNALNQLLGAKNNANTTYDTNKKSTAQDYVGSKNTIGSQAGSSLTGLRRLLGSRGAGGGSTYTIVAPEAVTRQATIQRSDVGNTFGKNNQSLYTNWNNYLTDYNNQVSSAGSQREQQRGSLSRQIEGSRASLLQQLAGLQGQRASAAGGNPTAAAQPYINQANSVLDAASRYSVSPINYQTKAYEAPDLSKYVVNPNAAPTYQGQTPGNDYFSPYLQALLGKKDQQPVGA